MPTSTLERKISVNNFFQNSEEISDALNRINEKSDQALQKSDSAVAKAFSNENYLQSLLQTISTQNETIERVSTENVTQTKLIERNVITQKEITQQVTNEIVKIKKDDNDQTQEISKAFGILRGLYDSLGSAVQSLRSDVESISRYLLDEQKQRQQQLEQREFRIAQQKDVTEKRDILKSLSKSMGVGAQDTVGREGDLPRPGGEESFFKTLVQGALSAAGIGLGTVTSETQQPDTPSPSPSGGATASAGQWKPLLDVIASGEGGYESVNPGQTVPGLTEMTIAEAWATAQRVGRSKGGSGAMGRYQLLSDPIGRARAAGLDPNKDKFSPANQDKIAVYIIENVRKGKQWLAGTLKGGDAAFAQGIANEWAGIPNLSGQYSYSGQGGKVKASSVKAALEQVKKSPTTTSTTKTQITSPAGQQATPQSTTSPAGQQVSAASEMKPGEEIAMRAPTGDVSAPFLGQVQSEKRSEAQPSISQMDTSSIVPFDYQPMQQVASSAGGSAQGSQGSQTNLSTAPDHPDAIPTNNPLTRMWTMSAINHLNINASMHHIYG